MTDETWGISDEGAAVIYFPGDTGPDYDTYAVVLHNPEAGGTAFVSRFGAALASGHVQELMWTDLAAGAPLHPDATDPGLEDGLGVDHPGHCDQLSELSRHRRYLDHVRLPGHCRHLEAVHGPRGRHHLPGVHGRLRVGLRGRQRHPVRALGRSWRSHPGGRLHPLGGASLQLDGAYSCPGSCVDETWFSADLGSLIQSIMQAEGSWSSLGAAVQSQIQGVTGDVTITFQGAGSSCNSGSIDQVAIELDVPDWVWTAMALTDSSFETDCRPEPNPASAELEDRFVCE